jgi:hypothetical protein
MVNGFDINVSCNISKCINNPCKYFHVPFASCLVKKIFLTETWQVLCRYIKIEERENIVQKVTPQAAEAGSRNRVIQKTLKRNTLKIIIFMWNPQSNVFKII